ncbi:MAG: hypothetical protein HQL69_07315 [Magnetococcales bacterium]|nr:hypothetical protein [Magnetococcales bacterium]
MSTNKTPQYKEVNRVSWAAKLLTALAVFVCLFAATPIIGEAKETIVWLHPDFPPIYIVDGAATPDHD